MSLLNIYKVEILKGTNSQNFDPQSLIFWKSDHQKNIFPKTTQESNHSKSKNSKVKIL